MRDFVFFFVVSLISMFVGYRVGTVSHAQDYSRGFSDGYWQRAAQTAPRTPMDSLRDNLVCRYAELACGGKAKK